MEDGRGADAECKADATAHVSDTGRLTRARNTHAGKLKDLGNSVLGKFGMSLDNFKAEKDPTTALTTSPSESEPAVTCGPSRELDTGGVPASLT